MISQWLLAFLVLSHVAMFIAGAVAYHGIRMLSSRPLYKPGGGGLNETKIQQMADKMTKEQMKSTLFNHLQGMEGPPPRREQEIPEGDGRPPKEEAFAPMQRK